MILTCPSCDSSFDSDHGCYCGYRPTYAQLTSLIASDYQAEDRSKRDVSERRVHRIGEPWREVHFQNLEIPEVDAEEAVRRYNKAYPSLRGRMQSAKTNETPCLPKDKDDSNL